MHFISKRIPEKEESKKNCLISTNIQGNIKFNNVCKNDDFSMIQISIRRCCNKFWIGSGIMMIVING